MTARVPCPICCPPPPPPPRPGDYIGVGINSSGPTYVGGAFNNASGPLCRLCENVWGRPTKRVPVELAAAYQLGGLQAALRIRRPPPRLLLAYARWWSSLPLLATRPRAAMLPGGTYTVVSSDSRLTAVASPYGRVWIRGLWPAILLSNLLTAALLLLAYWLLR